MIEFTVTGRYINGNSPTPHLYLKWDDWNDYSYYTLYGLVYHDNEGVFHDIGNVRIAYIGMDRHIHSIERNVTFITLADDFFSLGTSEEYYENLNKLSVEVRDHILYALRDIAKDPEVYDIAIAEEVTQDSLLRSISPATVTGQFRRMCHGGAKLTPYHFRFEVPSNTSQNGLSMSFVVTPETDPPTNVHVLIGKNGVGKTFLVNQMVDSLLDFDLLPQHGVFVGFLPPGETKLFSNLVFVTFSAFDEARPRQLWERRADGIRYHYIGLKRAEGSQLGPKDDDDLASEFLSSLNACKLRPYKDRWIAAVTEMERDPVFKDLDIIRLIHIPQDDPAFEELGYTAFRRLSSGHKIVLLSITRIVETLQEKTLIILDEPESHLHPPLLSMFICILSDLLLKINGVAIIATHSPVILQEVPRCCVWKLRRSGEITKADRLAFESYGENVGRLTNEVFGLEVTLSGFYKKLDEYVERGDNYESILARYGGNLGMEARAIVMALINQRDL